MTDMRAQAISPNERLLHLNPVNQFPEASHDRHARRWLH